MPLSWLILTVAVLSLLSVPFGRWAMVRVSARQNAPHCAAGFFGGFLAIVTAGSGFLALCLWLILMWVMRSSPSASADVNALAPLVVCAAVLGGGGWALTRLSPEFNARVFVEKTVVLFLFLCSLVAILTTVGVIVSVLFESLRFFRLVSPFEFLFGLHWSPQTALFEDQSSIGSSGAFGAVPVLAGTLMMTVIAITVALPVGLFAAIYLAEYASPGFRRWIKPSLEILAGIPTVVYGFFAALTVGPFLSRSGASLGFHLSAESALAAGSVMGVMLIPFISSLSDDMLKSVPVSLREAAYGLGATKYEGITQVVLPAAIPGLVGAFLLAVSRAIGETMIVVMAAGLAANLTANPFAAVTTVTVQIMTLLVGDQEFDSAKTLSAFALALVLFVLTMVLNLAALFVSRRYRKQYE